MSNSLWLAGGFNVIFGLICPAAKVFLLCAWQRDLWQQLIILNSKPQLFYSKNIFSDKKTLTWSKKIRLDIICSVLRWFEKSWSCFWSKNFVFSCFIWWQKISRYLYWEPSSSAWSRWKGRRWVLALNEVQINFMRKHSSTTNLLCLLNK